MFREINYQEGRSEERTSECKLFTEPQEIRPEYFLPFPVEEVGTEPAVRVFPEAVVLIRFRFRGVLHLKAEVRRLAKLLPPGLHTLPDDSFSPGVNGGMLCTDSLESVIVHPVQKPTPSIPTQNVHVVGIGEPIAEFLNLNRTLWIML